MLENCVKIMQLRVNFDACPMHSPFGSVHLTHQNLTGRALFCHNSLAKSKYAVINLLMIPGSLLGGFFTKEPLSYRDS